MSLKQNSAKNHTQPATFASAIEDAFVAQENQSAIDGALTETEAQEQVDQSMIARNADLAGTLNALFKDANEEPLPTKCAKCPRLVVCALMMLVGNGG